VGPADGREQRETLALVPWIVANGSACLLGHGDNTCPARRSSRSTGSVSKPGIAEVPMGMSVRSWSTFRRSRQREGGPCRWAGRRISPARRRLDTLYTTDGLKEKGAIVGSGSMVVVGPGTCIVDMATLLLRYLSDESCGKTIPGRIGVRRLYELGQRATNGLSKPNDGKWPQRLPRTFAMAPCAGSNGWRPTRSCPGCDTLPMNSKHTWCAVSARPVYATQFES
jgi:NADH:ubiquinone oxidoreductase subunit F (NADH-binding)